MLSEILKWGRRDEPAAGVSQPPGGAGGSDPGVPSKGLSKFLSALTLRSSPVLLDFGPVIGTNVAFFGEQLGCKLFIEDLLADVDRHARAGTSAALSTSFETRFRHADASVDGVLCWDVFDFLDKKAAPALARQVTRMLRPGGAVLGFFSSSPVERAPFVKYEIVDRTTLRHRRHPGNGAARRVLQNRDIIQMFEGLAVSDSFLLKSNTREVILRRR